MAAAIEVEIEADDTKTAARKDVPYARTSITLVLFFFASALPSESASHSRLLSVSSIAWSTGIGR